MNAESLGRSYSPVQLADLAAQWHRAENAHLGDAADSRLRRSVRLDRLEEARTAGLNARDFEEALGLLEPPSEAEMNEMALEAAGHRDSDFWTL